MYVFVCILLLSLKDEDDYDEDMGNAGKYNIPEQTRAKEQVKNTKLLNIISFLII